MPPKKALDELAQILLSLQIPNTDQWRRQLRETMEDYPEDFREILKQDFDDAMWTISAEGIQAAALERKMRMGAERKRADRDFERLQQREAAVPLPRKIRAAINNAIPKAKRALARNKMKILMFSFGVFVLQYNKDKIENLIYNLIYPKDKNQIKPGDIPYEEQIKNISEGLPPTPTPDRTLGLDPPDDPDEPDDGDDGDDEPNDDDDDDDDDGGNPDTPENLNRFFNSDKFKTIFNYLVKILSYSLGRFPLNKKMLIASGIITAETAGMDLLKAIAKGDITNPVNFASELFKILFDGSYGIEQSEKLETFNKLLENINYQEFTPEQMKELTDTMPTMELHVRGYTYAGPGTNFEKRVKGTFENSMPVNSLDYLTMKHDMYYQLKDPIAHMFSDEVLLEELKKRIFTNIPFTQRGLILSMMSVFTVKNRVERAAARMGSFGGFTKGLNGLQGDPKYLANDIISDKFEKINENWRKFATIMDDAGWSFTGPGGQLVFRKSSAGASKTGAKLYKDFLKDTKFLFKYDPPRDIKTNFTKQELATANEFVRTNMSNFNVLPNRIKTETETETETENETGQVLMGGNDINNISSINITDNMGLLADNRQDVLNIIKDLKKPNNAEAVKAFDNIIQLGMKDPNSTEGIILNSLINDKGTTLKILRPIAKKMGVKGRVSAMNKTKLRNIMNEKVSPPAPPAPAPKPPKPEITEPKITDRVDDKPTFEEQSAKSVGVEGEDFFKTDPPTTEPPTSAPTSPPTSAPTSAPSGTGDIGKLTDSIQQLINVIAVDTSNISPDLSGPNADVSEGVDAFAPYLAAQTDNPDSKETLEEDVIVSKEEQKESLESHGIFDYVSPDMWREKGNTFNQDRVLRDKLNFQAPLLVGYTNNSGLPWNKAKPNKFISGKPIIRRWDEANDREYQSRTQSANLFQGSDFVDLESMRDFYNSSLYNPDVYRMGFNSFRKIRSR